MSRPDRELLRWVLALTLAGFGCCAVSVILAFTGAAMGGRGGLLTAAHRLNWCAGACAAAVWGCALLLWRRARRVKRERGGQGS